MAMIKIDLRELHQQCLDATVKQDEHRLTEVSQRLEQFLEHDPHNWFAIFLLALAFRALGRASLAQALFYRASELKPDEVALWNNIGTCFRENHNVELAKQVFGKALERWPNEPDLLINLGTMNINEGTPAIGEGYLRRALEHNPLRAEAHWNLALTLLEQEKWKEGFSEYAWGQVGGNRMVKNYGSGANQATWWNGEKFDGTLITYGEQGVGDEVMYASMLSELSARCTKLVCDVHPRLVRVFRESFEGTSIEFHGTRKDFDEGNLDWATELDWDKPVYKIPLGNCPKYLRQSEADFHRRSYLVANRELVRTYEKLFSDHCKGKVPIGISWIGGAKSTRKDLRSIPLRQVYDAVAGLGSLISVQYTGSQEYFEPDMEIKDFPEIFESVRWEKHYPLTAAGERMREITGPGVFKDEDGYCYLNDKQLAKRISPVGKLAFTPPENGFDLRRTLAAFQTIHNLGGVVVTVNNSNVHFCGALGLPTFVLTPSAPAWRYGLERQDMIWYPEGSVMQFRQEAGEGWERPLRALRRRLKKYLNGQGSRYAA